LFKEKSISSASNNCRVVDELKNLKSSIDSKDYKNIAINLQRLQFRLTIAYGLETGLSGSRLNSKPVPASRLSKDLDVARKEFGKFSNLTQSEIATKIPEIMNSLKNAEYSLKSSC
jgi:CRISPR/Cas system CSM-associated protein Csm2 small subunit